MDWAYDKPFGTAQYREEGIPKLGGRAVGNTVLRHRLFCWGGNIEHSDSELEFNLQEVDHGLEGLSDDFSALMAEAADDCHEGEKMLLKLVVTVKA